MLILMIILDITIVSATGIVKSRNGWKMMSLAMTFRIVPNRVDGHLAMAGQ
jgi:hypothetical protein